jgi:hypothetical protein
MRTLAPRTARMRSLRRLQRRVDHTLASAGPKVVSSTRFGEIATLSRDVQRELSRLEELPWPSGRALVSYHDDRPLERRLLPLVRAVRDERAA